jgi:hypothetical protein
VEPIVVDHRMMAEAEEDFASDPHLLPHRTENLFHLIGGEGVVPRGHRRVGREDAGCTHSADGVRERNPARHELTRPLDQHEGGVSFIRVPGGRVVSQSAQHAHATDAEDPFLAKPQVGTASVEPVGQPAIRRVVLLEIRVQ